MKKQISCIGAGRAEIQEAYSWASNKSRLISILEQGHQETSLSKDEMETLCTWIDLNGVYYPEYESAYPDNPAGRSPISAEELNKLGKICAVDFSKLNGFTRTLGPQISFERPALSPCLASLKAGSKKYLEALDIIQKGQKQLELQARADMNDFVPCKEHQVQLEKYQQQKMIEEENNRALAEGRLIYDNE